MTITPITTLKDSDIFPNKEVVEITEWTPRRTVKIIIKNSAGKIALVTNPAHNFFLLPGGGVDEGEEIFIAADRESRGLFPCWEKYLCH